MKHKKEERFRKKLKYTLKNMFKTDTNIEISDKRSLLYKVFVDQELNYTPSTPKNPKRGDFAFETDILISKKLKSDTFIPLIVLEVKHGGFSTHDVLTYSSKAIKHKEIYPYLRYGLIVSKKKNIDTKFFIHNVGFDFAISFEKLDKNALRDIKNMIKNQIEIAENILSIFSGKKVKYYNTQVTIK
ncbi:MAG: hypothetical protein ABDH23_02790 [Endomicrobiia bacterium]